MAWTLYNSILPTEQRANLLAIIKAKIFDDAWQCRFLGGIDTKTSRKVKKNNIFGICSARFVELIPRRKIIGWKICRSYKEKTARIKWVVQTQKGNWKQKKRQKQEICQLNGPSPMNKKTENSEIFRRDILPKPKSPQKQHSNANDKI